MSFGLTGALPMTATRLEHRQFKTSIANGNAMED